jgi:hypothetical protein
METDPASETQSLKKQTTADNVQNMSQTDYQLKSVHSDLP